MYENGEGVEQDYQKAKNYYDVARHRGFVLAELHYQALEEKGY